MKKILMAQDIHVCPAWIEESKAHIAMICEVARAEKVDAITLAGDFFHKMFTASDRSCWPDVMQMARDMQETAPVFFVHGTPSHDAPGTYESFRDIGWTEVTIGKSAQIGELLILGIPEITTSMLAASFPEMNKQELIAKQYDLINQVIEQYYVPIATDHDGPVLFMGHGHVQGVKFRDDQKPRTTDFMYSEQLLSRIEADWYQFGHIHLPQEFKTISGGYGGSAHITWGDLGFRPGFTIVEFEAGATFPKRHFYGELGRQKVTVKDINKFSTIDAQIKHNVNLWLDIECDKDFADQFDAESSLKALKLKHELGPLSKVTCNIQHVEHQRVDSDEYEKADSLEDLYRLFDSEATTSVLAKVKEAEEETGSDPGLVNRHDFGFIELYLRGTKAGLENGYDEIRITAEDFRLGANLLTGPNGVGKSFSLGFMTPFSEHLPSGKNFKELFELKDSQILRKFSDNGKVITQKILIDPTLANPTAKFFMDIDGEPVANVTGNKEPFDKAVSDIFGSIKMFMTCAFRGQKDNPKFPSLENASEADLRRIFMELSGTDRSEMKNYAHDKVSSLKQSVVADTSRRETLSDQVETPGYFMDKIDQLGIDESEARKKLEALEQKKGEIEKHLSAINRDAESNERIDEQVKEYRNDIYHAKSNIERMNREIREFEDILNDADKHRSRLSELTEKSSKFSGLYEKYLQAVESHQQKVNAWFGDKEKLDTELREMASKAEQLKSNIRDYEREKLETEEGITYKENMMAEWNKPCEHCGKLPTNLQERINQFSAEKIELQKKLPKIESNISELNGRLEAMRKEYAELQKKQTPRPEEPAELIGLQQTAESCRVDPSDIDKAKALVASLDKAESEISKQKERIDESEKQIANIESKLQQLEAQKKPIDYSEKMQLSSELQETSSLAAQTNTEIGRILADVKSWSREHARNDKLLDEIKTIDSRLNTAQIDITEWEKIEAAFSPKGIPAMELSLIAPMIDREANALLDTYGTRFRVQTITQDYDSRGKNLIEKFKILVHDTKASDVKNLPDVSGGQGVWITKALQESIAKVASNRTGRNWLYSIMDEADAALDSEIIPVFYQMMDRALDGRRTLISVSHSSEAKAAIPSIIDIRDFMTTGGQ